MPSLWKYELYFEDICLQFETKSDWKMSHGMVSLKTFSVVPQGANGQCDIRNQKAPERNKDHIPNVAHNLET